MKNETIFKQNMAALCELFDKTLSDAVTSIYWQTLEQFTDEQCDKAFKVLTVTSRFFPKPVDFLEILQGKQENRATTSWLKVLNAVKRIGNYQSVRFDEPVIHSVIEAMGGWERLCLMECDDEKWKQKEFEKLYVVLSSHGGNHPDYLPGTIELTNFRTGFKTNDPVVQIGGTEQRKLANIESGDKD